jgi:hypothetical protein
MKSIVPAAGQPLSPKMASANGPDVEFQSKNVQRLDVQQLSKIRLDP